MLKTKYYYNPATCSYERAKPSILGLMVRSVVFLFLSALLAVAIVRYHQARFVSPKEAELLQDNQKLKSYYHMVQQKIESNQALLTSLQDSDNALRASLGREPLSAAERAAGMGGVNKYAHLGKDTLIAQTLFKADQLASELAIQKKSYAQIFSAAKKRKAQLASTPAFPPVSKRYLKRISAPFGRRMHPIYKILKLHEGVDFAVPMHSPIYAAADGYIKKIVKDKKGYGNHIMIEHGNGFKTRYAHMHTIAVKERQRIVRGQQIGTSGNSGASTAPHLHYEVYFNGNAVEPLQYFSAVLTLAEYEEVCKYAREQAKAEATCSNF